MRRNYYYLTVITMLTVAFAASGCEKVKREEEKVPVEIMNVKKEDLKESLFYVGDIKAKDEAIIYPKVTGKIIEEFVAEGDSVKKGDELVAVDRDEVGFQFEKAPVESPIDGIVGRVYVDIGTTVSPQVPVVLVVNMDRVKVKINVVEKDLPKIKEGQIAHVEVDAYSGEIFEGKVEMVSPIIEIASRTAVIEVGISNDEHKLKPGMFARVTIDVLKRKGVSCVLRDAVIREDNEMYCFVIKEDKAYKTKIIPGVEEGEKIEVIEGIKAGDIVVTTGQQNLKDGQSVEVIYKGARK
ncbi:MAG: efflux RND transporter periplasmic adaptor subunit [Candidatus Omnitrophica bacterium]|nr:efflux RND transporter periplasmic adaptor subunit [Candidatus Omnitrophota bacterium]